MSAMLTAEMAANANLTFSSSEQFRAYIAKMTPSSKEEQLDAAVTAYREKVVTPQSTTSQPEREQNPPQSISDPDPLTEKEAIEIVKKWVSEDAEYELPERRSFEEMVEN